MGPLKEVYVTKLMWVFFTFNYEKVYLFRSTDFKKLLKVKVTQKCKTVHTVFFYLLWRLTYWSLNAWITKHHNRGRTSAFEESEISVKFAHHSFKWIVKFHLSSSSLDYWTIHLSSQIKSRKSAKKRKNTQKLAVSNFWSFRWNKNMCRVIKGIISTFFWIS